MKAVLPGTCDCCDHAAGVVRFAMLDLAGNVLDSQLRCADCAYRFAKVGPDDAPERVRNKPYALRED